MFHRETQTTFRTRQPPFFTRLKVPDGLEELLAGLAKETIRYQPDNLYLFAAEYFEKLLFPANDEDEGRRKKKDEDDEIITTEYQLFRKDRKNEILRLRDVDSPVPVQINRIQYLVRQEDRNEDVKDEKMIRDRDSNAVPKDSVVEDHDEDVSVRPSPNRSTRPVANVDVASDRKVVVEDESPKSSLKSGSLDPTKDKKLHVSIASSSTEIQDVVRNDDQVDVTKIIHRVPWKYSNDEGQKPKKPKRKLCRRKTETDLDKLMNGSEFAKESVPVVPATAQILTKAMPGFPIVSSRAESPESDGPSVADGTKMSGTEYAESRLEDLISDGGSEGAVAVGSNPIEMDSTEDVTTDAECPFIDGGQRSSGDIGDSSEGQRSVTVASSPSESSQLHQSSESIYSKPVAYVYAMPSSQKSEDDEDNNKVSTVVSVENVPTAENVDENEIGKSTMAELSSSRLSSPSSLKDPQQYVLEIRDSPVDSVESDDVQSSTDVEKRIDEVPAESDLLTESDAAAVKIQAAYRGYRTRKDLANKRQGDAIEESSERERAAIKIQASYRGYRVRKGLEGARNKPNSDGNEKKDVGESDPALGDEAAAAATKIQAYYRGYKVRMDVRQKMDKSIIGAEAMDSEGSSSVIDAVENERTSSEEETAAAVKIQAAFRGYKARKEFRNGRGDVGHDDESNDGVGETSEDSKEKAATRIQATYRGYRTRQKLKESRSPSNSPMEDEMVEELKKRQEISATKIQACYKGYKVRRDMAKRKEGTDASLDECDDVVDVSDETRIVRDMAAVKIQAAYRGHRARRHSEKSKERRQRDVQNVGDIVERGKEDKREQAATRIQAAFKGYKVRKDLKEKDRKEATTSEGQLEADGGSDLIAKEKAAIRIQARYKGYKVRKEMKKSKMEERERAAVKIQATYKGYKVRKDMARSGQETTQKVGSGGVDEKSHEVQEAAAVKIQAAYKGYKTRKELKGKKENVVSERIGANRGLALKSAADRVREEERRKEKAAATIQAAYRGYKVRKDLMPNASDSVVRGSGSESEAAEDSKKSPRLEDEEKLVLEKEDGTRSDVATDLMEPLVELSGSDEDSDARRLSGTEEDRFFDSDAGLVVDEMESDTVKDEGSFLSGLGNSSEDIRVAGASAIDGEGTSEAKELKVDVSMAKDGGEVVGAGEKDAAADRYDDESDWKLKVSISDERLELSLYEYESSDDEQLDLKNAIDSSSIDEIDAIVSNDAKSMDGAKNESIIRFREVDDDADEIGSAEKSGTRNSNDPIKEPDGIGEMEKTDDEDKVSRLEIDGNVEESGGRLVAELAEVSESEIDVRSELSGNREENGPNSGGIFEPENSGGSLEVLRIADDEEHDNVEGEVATVNERTGIDRKQLDSEEGLLFISESGKDEVDGSEGVATVIDRTGVEKENPGSEKNLGASGKGEEPVPSTEVGVGMLPDGRRETYDFGESEIPNDDAVVDENRTTFVEDDRRTEIEPDHGDDWRRHVDVTADDQFVRKFDASSSSPPSPQLERCQGEERREESEQTIAESFSTSSLTEAEKDLKEQILSPRKIRTMNRKQYQFVRPSSSRQRFKTDESRAATKIQSTVRGFLVRKHMKIVPKQFGPEMKRIRRSEPEQVNQSSRLSIDGPSDATISESPVRNPKTLKVYQFKRTAPSISGSDCGDPGPSANVDRTDDGMSSDDGASVAGTSGNGSHRQNSSDIVHSSDYPKTELDKAATKIQASFRGYKTRLESSKRRHEE